MSEMTVEATLENLEVVTQFINDQLELAECSVKIITQVDIVVEEIYVNIAQYAYHPEIGEAVIRCEVGNEPLQVIIEFLDNGTPYNPLEKQDPDITLNVEERPVGGLGIFMAKKLMDEISYEFKDGKNVLTLRKTI